MLRVNFVEGMEAGVLAAKGCATRLLDARLRGKDPSAALRVNSGGVGVSAGSVHGYRIGERCGGREVGDGRGY